MARMILNETAYFGSGVRSELPGELRKCARGKALIVTDADLLTFGVAKLVTDVLDEVGFPYEIFADVKANPTIANVKAGLAAYRKAGADALIAIGGGSVIDTAKAIGIVDRNPEFSEVRTLEGAQSTKVKSAPVFAFATTSGTAAEVTINYVITDEDDKRKLVCIDPNDIPAVAFNDADLLASMPKGLTASTGMDALTHAIEGYTTKGAWYLTDQLCDTSIKLIADNLSAAVADGKNVFARENMALGSYVAGMAFSNVGLGIVHSMAHPLGARFDMPHGVANALLLPFVMEYNKPACPEKYAKIARAMGVDTSKMNIEEAADAAIAAVKKLSEKIGIPKRLSDVGIKAEDLPILAEDAYKDPCTGGNPRDTSVAEILEIYKQAL